MRILIFLITVALVSDLSGRSIKQIGVLRHVNMLPPEHIAALEKLFVQHSVRYEDQGVIRFTFPPHFRGREMTSEAAPHMSGSHAHEEVAFANKQLNQFMGLSSWVAFQKGKKDNIETMMMGDIVLFENQINPAIDAALAHGIAVTALHHHFLYDTPKVYHMHLEAEGSVATISQGVAAILKAAEKAPDKQPNFGNDKNSISGEDISHALGIPGESKDGMFKFVVGRTVRAGCGCTVGAAMGINTWGVFSGASGHAVVDGDFVLLEREVKPVMKYLRKAGFLIVSVHNHMLFETPRLIFMHYIGYGPAVSLAQTLKGALALTNTK